MYLKTLEIGLLKYVLDPAHFRSEPELTWKAAFNKTKVKIRSLN